MERRMNGLLNKTMMILLLNMIPFAQATAQEETETISLSRKSLLYKGIGQEIQNWYLYMDQDRIWYMAPLVGIEEKPAEWFEKRKDSQNVFKGAMENGTYPTLTLNKENDPEASLQFYVKKEGNNRIVLTSVSDASVYLFELK